MLSEINIHHFGPAEDDYIHVCGVFITCGRRLARPGAGSLWLWQQKHSITDTLAERLHCRQINRFQRQGKDSIYRRKNS